MIFAKRVGVGTASWNATLKEIGAIPIHSDPYLYRIDSGEYSMLIAIYVDNILVAAKDPSVITELGRKLVSRFGLKNLFFLKCENALRIPLPPGKRGLCGTRVKIPHTH